MGIKVFGQNVEAGDAVAGYYSGGLSAVDKLTGDNAGKGLRDARHTIFGKQDVKEAAGPDPGALQQLSPDAYSKMPKNQSAPQMQAAQLHNAAQINLDDPRWAVLQHGPQEQFRNQQMSLANQLSQQAAGQGPSVAQNQMRQAAAANQAATFAQLASARGGANPALARQAMQTSAGIGNRLAVDAGTARLQEQMAAAGMLGQVSNAARGQDIGIAGTQAGLAQSQAGLEQQGAIFNAEQQQKAAMENAQQQMQFQNLQQKYQAMGMDAAKANQYAALEFEKMRTDVGKTNTAADNAAAASQQGFIRGLADKALGTAGTAGMKAATGGSGTAASPAKE